MAQFSWQPIYGRMARKLLEFEDRQPELWAMLATLKAKGLPVVAPPKNLPGLQEIDPLTFFAAFNRGKVSDTNRQKIINELQELMGFAVEIPADFDGIPVANQFQSRFFKDPPQLKPNDIADIWAIVRTALMLGPAGIKVDLFNRAADSISLHKFTIGLYWVASDKFLPLDQHTRKFIEEKGVMSNAMDLAGYSAVMQAVHVNDKLGTDHAAISATAVGVTVDEPRTLPPKTMPLAQPAEPTNKILYGPPGTGKTFATIDEALKIIDPAFQLSNAADRPTLKKRYDSLVESGQIGFVTFHQSFSYEDFVEGLRAENAEETDALRYRVADGVFKQMCAKASALPVAVASELGVAARPRIWKLSLDGTGSSNTRKYCFNHDEARIGWGWIGDLRSADVADPKHGLGSNDQSTLRIFSQEIQRGDIILCIHSNTEIGAVGIVLGDYDFEAAPPPDVSEGYQHVRKVKWLLKDLKFSILPLNGDVQLTLKTAYELRRFSWTELQLALQTAGHGLPTSDARATTIPVVAQPHVLVIDEINRGNVSRIFGELITLIEPSKRRGQPEGLEVMLPYSKKPFSVPSNLHLVGTMNTADRSLSQLDIALRRRFVFQEMPPQPELLDGVVVDGVNIGQLLRTMNERIEVLLDRDHCLGHAYFLPLKQTPTPPLSTLSQIFRQQILPLLLEYFFEDWQKIALVLNDHSKSADHQMLRQPESNIAKLFGSECNNVVDRRWSICWPAFDKIESYQGIIP